MQYFERVDKDDLSWELYHGDHLQRYYFFKDYYIHKNVLDAACGSGYGAEIIAQSNASYVTGVDIDSKIIEKNKNQYASHHKLVFHTLSCEDIDKLQQKFDVIMSFETIEHLKNPQMFIQKAFLCLKEGGHFICSTPNVHRFKGFHQHPSENPYHIYEFSFDEIKNLISGHFKIKKIYHQSESIQFLRYMELKHEFFQYQRQINSTLFVRFELWLRKLFRKTFQPIPFFYPYCAKQTVDDFIIEEIQKPESWHKTYIFIAEK